MPSWRNVTRVLVTGASGFIGRALVLALAKKHDVLSPRHSELELADADAVAAYLRHWRPDVIVHGAVKPAHRNAYDLTRIVEANERMFFNLVRDRSLCPRMVFLSSGAVYSSLHFRDRMSESYFDQHVPEDEHGFSKYVIAKYIENSAGIIELRIFGIFGPYEDYAIRFISNALCKTLFNMPVTLRQDRKFDYLWVDDLMPVVEHFIEPGSATGAFNVTPDETSSLKAVGELVIAVSRNHVPLHVASDELGPPYTGDNSRLHAEIPGLHFTPMPEAVERLYAWYAARKNEIDHDALLVDK